MWSHSCKMCLRSLGFVLILFPGVLQAQGCDAPRLLHGNFVPKQQTYSHGTTITYACDNGYKPAVEGWWATSTCQHGTWSHEPQCIGESSCLPPTIPNATYPENSNGWYEDGSTLRITCEAGFEHKNQNTATTCENGNWSPVPVCERSADTSGSNDRDSRPALTNIQLCGKHPVIQNAEVVEERPMYLKYQCNSYFRRVGPETVNCYSDGSWSQLPTCEVEEMDRERVESAGSGRQPSGGGSADTSASNDRDSRPALTNIQLCGNRPVIQDAEVVEEGSMYLKYQCIRYYRRVGPETVNCYSDGSWSQLPTCEEAFCVMDAAKYAQYGVKPGQREYIEDGETKFFQCTSRGYYIHVRCTNRRITLTWCCSNNDRYYYDYCTRFTEPN